MNQEKHFNFFNFWSQTFTIYGIQIFIVTVITYLSPAGDIPQTGILRLWPQGLASDSLMQFFISSFGVALLNTIFTTDLIFKKMLNLWRIIFMLASDILFVSFLIHLFDWFPAEQSAYRFAWILFLINFFLLFGAGMLIMVLRTRYENKKYDKILKTFKERKEKSQNESDK